MKTNSTFDRISLRGLPTGRRNFAVRRVKEEAVALQAEVADEQRSALDGLAQQCDATDLQHQDTSEKERVYAAASAESGSPAAGERVRVDRRGDQIIGGIHHTATGFIKGYEPQDPEYQQASAFLAQAFPKGVVGITHAAYPEQLQQMKTLLNYCKTDGAAAVAVMGLGRWIERLEAIIPEYEQAIARAELPAITFAQVDAARRVGHLKLRQIVARVFGIFPDADATSEAYRARLLAPIAAQELAVAEAQRRHLTVHDIDAATGAEQDTAVELPRDID